MGRNGFLAVLLFFFIVMNVSDASFVGKFRKLLRVPTGNTTNTENSTVPSPVSGGNDTIPNSTVAKKPIKEESNDTQVHNDRSKADPKGSNNTGFGSLPIQKQKDGQNNHQERKINNTQNDKEPETVGNCDGLPYKCSDKKIIAWVQSFGSGIKEVALLVQNEGESSLKVNITVSTSAKNAFEVDVEIPKRQTKRINISLAIVEGIKIEVNSSNGDCVIHMGSPVSKVNISQRFPPYSKLVVTPLYGVCCLFLTALIVGGSWACLLQVQKKETAGWSPI